MAALKSLWRVLLCSCTFVGLLCCEQGIGDDQEPLPLARGGRELESINLFGKLTEQRIPQARDYPRAALERPRNFSDYNEYELQWADPFKYEKQDVIGHGTYADVFLGHVRGNASQKVVIKQLKHATWYKIKREVLIMKAVQDHPNIIKLLDVVPNLRNRQNGEAPPISSTTRRSAPRTALSTDIERQQSLSANCGGGGFHLSSLSASTNSSSPGAGESAVHHTQQQQQQQQQRPAMSRSGQPHHPAGCEAAELSGEHEGAAGFLQGGHSRSSSRQSSVDTGTDQQRGLKESGSLPSNDGGGTGRKSRARGKRVGDRKLHTHSHLKGPADMEPSLLKFVGDLLGGLDPSKGWFLDFQRPVSLVLGAVKTEPYDVLLPNYSLEVARTYTRQLVEALEHAHSRGIMHRDVKTSNSFVDPHQRKHYLGDWGLGEFYFPKQAYKYSVSTRAYKAPELLLKYTRYTYAIDMWGVGMHLGSYAFQRKQIFGYASDERGMLHSQAKVLGTSGLKKLAEKYGMQMPDPPIPYYPKSPWEKMYDLKPGLATPECLDFIDRLLRWDPEERMTASEALQHPFLTGKPLSAYRAPSLSVLKKFG